MSHGAITLGMQNGLLQQTALFQNYPSNNGEPDCRAALQHATAIGFLSNSANVSVCMDDLQLLPSTVISDGTALPLLQRAAL